jgi:hypothetical protein
MQSSIDAAASRNQKVMRTPQNASNGAAGVKKPKDADVIKGKANPPVG